MHTRTFRNTYASFSELSPERKREEIEKAVEINVPWGWWEYAYDEIEGMARFFGIETNRNAFGFDVERKYFGMSGHLHFLSLRRALKSKPEAGYKAAEDLHAAFSAAKARQTAGVCAQAYKFANCENPGAVAKVRDEAGRFGTLGQVDRATTLAVVEQQEQLEELCVDVLKMFCEWAGKMLADEYAYLTSEAAIIESLEAWDTEYLISTEVVENADVEAEEDEEYDDEE